MFVVTEELQEVIDSFKQTAKILKNPKELLQVLGVLFCFVTMYFCMIVIADLIQGM